MGGRKALINELVDAGLITLEQATILDTDHSCCLAQLIGQSAPIEDAGAGLPDLRRAVNEILAALRERGLVAE